MCVNQPCSVEISGAVLILYVGSSAPADTRPQYSIHYIGRLKLGTVISGVLGPVQSLDVQGEGKQTGQGEGEVVAKMVVLCCNHQPWVSHDD